MDLPPTSTVYAICDWTQDRMLDRIRYALYVQHLKYVQHRKKIGRDARPHCRRALKKADPPLIRMGLTAVSSSGERSATFRRHAATAVTGTRHVVLRSGSHSGNRSDVDFVSLGLNKKMIIVQFRLLAVWRGLRPANPCLRLRLAPSGMFLGSAGKGVSSSRPDDPKVPGAAAVKDGRRPPRLRGA